MANPKSALKLLYVTPEKMAKSKRFMAKLQACHKSGLFSRLAIDEVHCCSQWGHDFRPDYKFLGVVRQLFPGVPILGLTATATRSVLDDCKKMLNLSNCLVFKAPFNRPNLYYQVRSKPDNQEESIALLAASLKNEFSGQSGIIYTLSIKDVEQITMSLKRDHGLKVAPYHAQLDAKDRSKIHRKWLTGEYQAVVATIAFGMGIDKPDVRFVVHHCISKSMENYYQESGRAGRDDSEARCLVYFSFKDVFRLSTMVFTDATGLEKLYGMVRYCGGEEKSCRRGLISRHFGENWSSEAAAANCNSMCDRCESKDDLDEGRRLHLKVIAEHAEAVLGVAGRGDIRVTPLKLVNSLMGKGEAALRVQNGRKWGKEEAEKSVVKLLLAGFLKEDFAFTPYSTLSYIVRGSLNLDSLNNEYIVVDSNPKSSSVGKKRKSKSGESSRNAPKKAKDKNDDDVIFIFDDDK